MPEDSLQQRQAAHGPVKLAEGKCETQKRHLKLHKCEPETVPLKSGSSSGRLLVTCSPPSRSTGLHKLVGWLQNTLVSHSCPLAVLFLSSSKHLKHRKSTCLTFPRGGKCEDLSGGTKNKSKTAAKINLTAELRPGSEWLHISLHVWNFAAFQQVRCERAKHARRDQCTDGQMRRRKLRPLFFVSIFRC